MFTEALAYLWSYVTACFGCRNFRKMKEGFFFQEKVDIVDLEDEVKLVSKLKHEGWYKNDSILDMTKRREGRFRNEMQHRRKDENASEEVEINRFGTLSSFNFRVRNSILIFR